MQSVSYFQICLDNFACCLTESVLSDQTRYHTQSEYVGPRQTSPGIDPPVPGIWQVSHLIMHRHTCMYTHVGVRVWASLFYEYEQSCLYVSLSLSLYLYMCRCMCLCVDVYMCMNMIVS